MVMQKNMRLHLQPQFNNLVKRVKVLIMPSSFVMTLALLNIGPLNTDFIQATIVFLNASLCFQLAVSTSPNIGVISPSSPVNVILALKFSPC